MRKVSRVLRRNGTINPCVSDINVVKHIKETYELTETRPAYRNADI